MKLPSADLYKRSTSIAYEQSEVSSGRQGLTPAGTRNTRRGSLSAARARRRASRLLELVVEVNAHGARLAHRHAIESRQVDGGLRDVVEERALVGDVVHEEHGGPALALESAPEVGEIVGGQRIGGEGLVRAAADVVRLGPGRQGKIIRELVMVGERDRGARSRHLLDLRARIEARIDERRAHELRVRKGDARRRLEIAHEDRACLDLAAVDMRIAYVRRIDVTARGERIDLLHAHPALEVARGVDAEATIRGAPLLTELVAPHAVGRKRDRPVDEPFGAVLDHQLRLAGARSRGRHRAGAAARAEAFRW